MTTASPDNFTPTRWSLVLRAQADSPEASAALSDLCAAYYEPVYRFLRREGRSEDAARELAQAFFAQVLERKNLAADQRRGRFRSYLLGAVKHFLTDQRKHEARAKRGSGTTPESLDAEENAIPQDQLPVSPEASDRWFDRQWALNIMQRGLENVGQTWEKNGKSEHFSILQAWLVGNATGQTYLDAASRLQWSEAAVKVAIHRLRKQFREAIRREIAETLPLDADINEELRYLVEILRETPDLGSAETQPSAGSE